MKISTVFYLLQLASLSISPNSTNLFIRYSPPGLSYHTMYYNNKQKEEYLWDSVLEAVTMVALAVLDVLSSSSSSYYLPVALVLTIVLQIVDLPYLIYYIPSSYNHVSSKRGLFFYIKENVDLSLNNLL